jgi:hypothetical protein
MIDLPGRNDTRYFCQWADQDFDVFATVGHGCAHLTAIPEQDRVAAVVQESRIRSDIPQDPCALPGKSGFLAEFPRGSLNGRFLRIHLPARYLECEFASAVPELPDEDDLLITLTQSPASSREMLRISPVRGERERRR